MARKRSAATKTPVTAIKRGEIAEPGAAGKKANKHANPASKKSLRRARSESDAKAERAEGLQAGNTSFPVVGIGASAGGLEAFRQLLEHLPVDTGMAFVLVQHLDPTHDSILTELLSRSTGMPVREVTDGMAVAPDHIYVIPRNTNMAIAEGVLRLLPREEARGLHRPIDYFLRTLAEDQRHRAIGVILSGTASDGTLGLEAIKAEGGITFAQDTRSAKYDSMPRSAIAAGHVDFILTPEGIATELARISRHSFVTPPAGTATHVEAEVQSPGRNGFRKILTLLRKAKGVDFTDYKAKTLHRRIARRMVLNRLEGLEDYATLLRENAAEVEALYQDILINVTSFFRNPQTFAVLKDRIFPRIVQQRTPDEPIRIWTLGCLTGEEAYSIAISFVEFAGDHGDHIPVQIFATDLSDRGIEKARGGLYSKDIAEDVSPERLRRFFTEAEDGYRVSKPIRDMVVFARQNVLADPPFSRLDLISCRNLLIYLEPVLQRQVLPTLHYALKPAGVLWLGSSETVGSATDLFTPEDKKHRFYLKKLRSSRLHFQSTREFPTGDRSELGQQMSKVSEQIRTEHDAQKEADRILLARYSPASVLINAELEILQFRGSAGAYLEPPSGKATLNLLKMAREGLMLPLRVAIQKSKKDDATVRKEGVPGNYDGKVRQVNLEVVPIKGLAANERLFLVLFEPAPTPNLGQETMPRETKAGRTNRRTDGGQVARLQEELSATREYMQTLVEQQEAANEELQSSSEEIQSSNEELQSINEELETAKEELESSNEELATLNDELHNRNQELTTLNDDSNNLHVSINIPLLMVGRDLRIRRFTPQAERVLSLIATDAGRPVGDIKLKINVPDLEDLIVEVIDTVSVKEREVQDREGRWYAMRIRPYQTLDNKIDGAVIVLMDIDALKQSEAGIREAREYAEAIVRTARDPLLILNADLRVHTANEAFYHTFKVSPAESEGRLIYELGDRQWNIPRLRELLEEILPRNSFFDNFEVTHDFESIGRRAMLLNARRLDDAGGQPARILLGIQDITEVLHFQAAARQSQVRYQALMQASAQIVWTTDADGAVVEDSPSWRAFTGQTYEEWKGFGWLDVFHPDDRERVSDQWQRTVAERAPLEIEYRIRHTSGDWRWTVARAVPVLNSDGSVREWVGMNNDITERKRAEEALRASEERYRSLFASAPMAVFACDRNAVIQHYNQRAVELWGREPARGVEQHCGSVKLWLPDDTLLPHVQSPIVEVLRTGIPELNVEVFIERPDGSRLPVLVNFSALKNEQGEITGAITSFIDITERKQAEALTVLQKEAFEMAASGASLMQVLEFLARAVEGQSPQRAMMAIHLLDEAGTRFEQTAAPSLPASYAEATNGMEVSSATGPCCAAIASRRRVVVADVSASEQFAAFAAFASPLGIRAGWSTPIFSSTGKVLGTFASYYRKACEPSPQDNLLGDVVTRTASVIIERKQAEEALRKAGERFRFMAESMPQKIFTARPNGEVDYFNEQWMKFTGLSFEQIIDWGWTQFIHSDDVEDNIRAWQHSIDTGEEFQFEHRFRRADGEYRWHLSRAHAMRDAEGKVLMWIGSNTDIGDVKRAEAEREDLLAREQKARQEAEDANRTKDEFLATVSHELRTPLNAILGWAEILKRGALDEETASHAAETIARNARVQTQLISDLLDVSRITSGKVRFEMGAVELITVIEAAMDTVRPAADAKGMDLHLEPNHAVGLVSGDASRLQQVVWNLLSNAIKYSSKGGRVDVWLEREDSNVAIIVRDTGEGIRPEFLPYIFDRFRQADSATTRRHGGLGLGLAIVRHLVELHGGTVRAESGGAGQGATFTVTLPLIAVRREGDDAQAAEPVEALSGRTPSHRPLTGLRVLVVDDDPDARELLRLSLTQDGADVRAGATAQEALEIMDQWKPDVLVSDIGMPGEDGYNLIRQLRARDEERGGLIPAVALTGYAADSDASHAREAGFQIHLPKPVEPATLITTVARLARSRRGRPLDSQVVDEESNGSGSHNP